MKRKAEFERHDRHRAPWRRGEGAEWPVFAVLVDLALQVGLWAVACLVIASSAPAALATPLLRELLLMTAFVVSLLGLWRGESVNLTRFNRQDVAIALIALAVIAGFFVDPVAVEAFMLAEAG